MSRWTIGWMTVVFALVCGCASGPSGPVVELPPHELLAELNRSAALVQTVDTNYVDARIYLAEHMLISAGLDGKLRFQQPGLFRLRLEHALKGPVADAGSNAEAWWLHLPEPDDVMYLGRVAAPPPAEGELPMQADEVAWALGIMPIGGPGVEIGRREGDYLVRQLEPVPEGPPRVRREFLVDGRTLGVTRFRSFFDDGKVKLEAELGEHVDLGKAPGDGLRRNVYMPTRIRLDWGEAGWLRLKLQYLKIGDKLNPAFFVVPEPDGRIIPVE